MLFQGHRRLVTRILARAQEAITTALRAALDVPDGVPADVRALQTFGSPSIPILTSMPSSPMAFSTPKASSTRRGGAAPSKKLGLDAPWEPIKLL